MEFQGSYLQATTVLTKVKKIAIGISVSTEVLAKEMLTWISISCNPMHRRFFKSDGEKKIQTHFFFNVLKNSCGTWITYLSC